TPARWSVTRSPRAIDTAMAPAHPAALRWWTHISIPLDRSAMNVRRTAPVLLATLFVLGLCSLRATADTASPGQQPRLVDFLAGPGPTQKLQPFLLHADYWQGLDQRAKLDSIVFVLENGARCAKVLDRDSTWAVDYTWVYPHALFPPRWYDAKSLIHT